MSSSDDQNKKAEEMSLEELLGHQGGAPTDDYDDLDEDQKRNEAGSGLINLSALVGATAPAATPAAAQPAPGAPAGQPVGAPAAGIPASATANQPAMAAAPVKKSPLPLIIGGAVGIVVIAVVAILLLGGGKGDKPQTSGELAQMEMELKAMLAKAEAAGDESAKQKLQDKIAAVERGEDVEMDFDMGEEEAGAEDEMEMSSEEAGGTKGIRRTGKRRVATTAKTSTTEKQPEAKKEEPKTLTGKLASTAQKSDAPATAGGTKKDGSKTSALDSLLTGGGSAKNSGGLPDQPTRAQVTQAMARVKAKASGVCAKGFSGVVKVRVIVSSNGKVRDAVPVGEHATDTIGRCVAKMARGTAQFPKFKKPTFTFTFPFRF